MPISNLWLQNSASPVTPGRLAASFPWGTDNGGPQRNNVLTETDPGNASFFGIGWTSLAQTARQSYYVFAGISNQLAAIAIGAGTWTFDVYGDQQNVAANQFWAVALYLWRSGSGKVATIYDSQAELGSEFGGAAISFTVAGSGVTPQLNDRIVCEAWVTAAQSMSTAYSVSTQVGGNTSNTQFKITPPSTIYLAGETPPVASAFNPLALAGD